MPKLPKPTVKDLAELAPMLQAVAGRCETIGSELDELAEVRRERLHRRSDAYQESDAGLEEAGYIDNVTALGEALVAIMEAVEAFTTAREELA